MLTELKDKSQVTIPSKIVKELGLVRGDMFDVIIHDGAIELVPVVVYPKSKIEELERLATASHEEYLQGEGTTYNDIDQALDALHKAGK